MSLNLCKIALRVTIAVNSTFFKKVLYHWGVRRRGKEGKYRNVGLKIVVGFRSVSIFLARKRKGVSQDGTMEPGG